MAEEKKKPSVGCLLFITLFAIAAAWQLAERIWKWIVPPKPAVVYATPPSPAAPPSPAVQQAARTPAQDRLSAARQLEQTFDASLLKNMELKFIVRGPGCNVLHVESPNSNLYVEMMEALAYGTVLYGKVLPGGVNAFAFHRDFREVVYTNRLNKVFVSYGPSKLKRDAVLKLKPCSEALAASLLTDAPAGVYPTPPPFALLSWSTATVGQMLYGASYKHEATIVGVDKPAGRITVKYKRTGEVEPKNLEAVAKLWYVRQ